MKIKIYIHDKNSKDSNGIFLILTGTIVSISFSSIKPIGVSRFELVITGKLLS